MSRYYQRKRTERRCYTIRDFEHMINCIRLYFGNLLKDPIHIKMYGSSIEFMHHELEKKLKPCSSDFERQTTIEVFKEVYEEFIRSSKKETA